MAVSPTKLPVKKVTYGVVAGGTLGTSISVIFVYWLGAIGHPIPAEVAGAISSLITVLVGFVASYIVPPEEPPTTQ